MNAYFVQELVRQRHAGFLREVERDELAAQFHGATPGDRGMPSTSGALAPIGIGERWRHLLALLAPPHWPAHGHHS